ncbi:hypothetical protein GCM10017643_21880 [Ancylobacter dichloromethanicus]|uniref:Uncharacterized protein n=1 Tax=Ancylobacter dichloromethanicus TaxID=518825 RepID=A0A9W6MZJ8_9HYPH|nr:hypothetical protein GCM10017643_21880 [Ancylobacter dichloromethanicus]
MRASRRWAIGWAAVGSLQARHVPPPNKSYIIYDIVRTKDQAAFVGGDSKMFTLPARSPA